MALHYVLDGYNIIKCVDVLADLSLRDGRDELLKLLVTQRPQGSARNSVTVVFDGQPDVWGQSGVPGIRVIFTSGGTADDHIKQLVEHITRKPDIKSVVVVTNDREICCYVRKLGAEVLSVQEFLGLKGGLGVGKRPLGKKGGVRKEVKQITRVTQDKINRELEDIWINRKKKL